MLRTHATAARHADVRRRARLTGRALAWTVIVGVVAAGLVGQVARPLAPDLGAVPDPERWFGVELLDRIEAYRAPLRIAGVALTLLDVVVPVLVAFTSAGRRLVERIVHIVGPSRPARAATAVIVVVVALTGLAGLPIGIWAHGHAVAVGLSTQSLGGWLGDWAIARAIDLAIAAGLGLAGYAVLRRWPRRWYLVAAPSGVVLVALAVVVSPLIVEPLVFDLRPLPDGPVREQLEAVVAADGRSEATLLVADASRRTTAQNAYVSGLWGTRRIVVYDTMLERPPAQIAQVLAHELAHQRNRDLLRGVLAGAAGWVMLCGLLVSWLRWRVVTGAQPTVWSPHGAAAVVAVIALAVTLTTPVVAWSSRRAEAAADLGALELTGDPTTFCAMQYGLTERNLSDPAPPTWQRLWSWTHPPGASRLLLAERWSAGADARCHRPSAAPSVANGARTPPTIATFEQHPQRSDG